MAGGSFVIIEGIPKGLPTTFRLEGDLPQGESPMTPVEVRRYALGLKAPNDGAKNRKVVSPSFPIVEAFVAALSAMPGAS
jgi:hypothetical protein